MKSILDNQTSFPLRQVKKAVYWVLRELDVNDERLLVRITHQVDGVEKHGGRFYQEARRFPRVWKRTKIAIPDSVEYLIVGRVPEYPWGENRRDYKKGPPSIVPETWLESLICIVAHEAMHFRQFLNKQPASEVECEWAEYRLLKRWRERD